MIRWWLDYCNWLWRSLCVSDQRTIILTFNIQFQIDLGRMQADHLVLHLCLKSGTEVRMLLSKHQYLYLLSNTVKFHSKPRAICTYKHICLFLWYKTVSNKLRLYVLSMIYASCWAVWKTMFLAIKGLKLSVYFLNIRMYLKSLYIEIVLSSTSNIWTNCILILGNWRH